MTKLLTDGGRRQFMKAALAVLAFPGSALAGVWDELGCICQKIGAHWTICRKPWEKSTLEEFKAHLCATHGHKPDELKHLTKTRALLLHDVHHDGGSYNDGKLAFSVPKPSKGMMIRGK